MLSPMCQVPFLDGEAMRVATSLPWTFWKELHATPHRVCSVCVVEESQHSLFCPVELALTYVPYLQLESARHLPSQSVFELAYRRWPPSEMYGYLPIW